jgi:hypothetical protein
MIKRFLLLTVALSLLMLTGCQAFFIGVEETVEMEEAVVVEQPILTTDANVEFVRAVNNGGSWTFHVTVRHPDTGWDDYTDGWDVVLPDGTVLKRNADDPFTRLLLHPHETEQPFMRSQSGLVIPDDVTQVTVRAHDLVDGFGGIEVVVDLTVVEGENYLVE